MQTGGTDDKESTCKVGDLGSIPGWEDPLEKGTATHSSILAWRIPWTEEPGTLREPWAHKTEWLSLHSLEGNKRVKIKAAEHLTLEGQG